MTTTRPHDDALRLDLIRVTAQLLAESGPSAVSLREIAQKCGTSTTAIYSLFGGKAQIIKAVAAEGFADLAISLAGNERHDTPFDALLGLAHIYHTWALENPALFAAMYSQPQPSFSPGAPARTEKEGEMEQLLRSAIEAAFQPVEEAARQAAPESGLTARGIADSVYAVVHGWITLEQLHLMKGLDFDTYAAATITGILTPTA